jgi:hypothetical protein
MSDPQTLAPERIWVFPFGFGLPEDTEGKWRDSPTFMAERTSDGHGTIEYVLAASVEAQVKELEELRAHIQALESKLALARTLACHVVDYEWEGNPYFLEQDEMVKTAELLFDTIDGPTDKTDKTEHE